MPVRPMLLHHNVGLVSFRLFCKNLGNLQEFFRQMIYRPPPPWPKISLTPMVAAVVSAVAVKSVVSVVRVVAVVSVVSVVAAVVSVVAVVCVVAVVLVQ